MDEKQDANPMKTIIKLIGVILIVFGVLFLSNKYSGSNTDSTYSQTNVDKEASNAIEDFKGAQGPANGFVFGGIGTYRTLTAELMHNDSDNSYRFSMRDSRDTDPYVTFYLARIIAPGTDKYQYVAFPIKGSKNNDFVQWAIKGKKLAVISNGADARNHNPLMINIDDIDSNFSLSPSKKFTLHDND